MNHLSRQSVLVLVVLLPCLLIAGSVSPAVADDSYEPNNSFLSSYDLATQAGVWLSAINGPGISSDQDWYRIEVAPGQDKLVVTCTFSHDLGDIDIFLYDLTGVGLVGESLGETDIEQISICGLASGTYYILVDTFGDYVDNSYDLRWQTFSSCADDCYEENDDLGSATNLSAYAGVWLSSISADPACDPLQADDDWYAITLPPGQQLLTIDCTFAHAEGNIDIELYDASGTIQVARSSSFTDDETIRICLDAGGTYYLRVANANAGNAYDLWWNSTPGCGLWEVCGAVDLGGGWWWLDWFGFFNRNFDPWTYHDQHRFLYPFGNDCSGIVFWDNSMQAFWWTSATVYPYVYRFSDNEWLFYLLGSVDPRLFNILSQDIWQQW